MGGSLADALYAGLLIAGSVAAAAALWAFARQRRRHALDLRERSAAQSALARELAGSRETERWSSGLIEAAPVGLMVIDAQGRIVHANRTALGIFGYEPGELDGMAVEDLMPEDRRHGHPEKVRATFTNPVSRSLASKDGIFGRRRDGTIFPADIGLNTLQVRPGDARQIAVSVTDLS
ncbi:PAS domain S-box protein [Pseudoxanthobacter sp.]|uniref:PAS domain-containing protein n=1 Tax=Pseudoxanthobacter sp. TaxID=1925742 RepID=UPI002FE31E1E